MKTITISDSLYEDLVRICRHKSLTLEECIEKMKNNAFDKLDEECEQINR